MSEKQTSVFVDVGPEAYLPAMMDTNEVTYGGLQATKIDVGGTEIMVYQEVDKSYLQEYLEEPVEKTCNPTPTTTHMCVDSNTCAQPPRATDKAPPKNMNLQKTSPPSNGLRCPQCPRGFRDEDLLLQHVKRHRGEKPFACYMCEYTTVNKTMFQEHLYMHQGVKPFKCKYCEHQSGSRKNLKKHEQRHQDGYRLKCPNCVFLGRNQSSLNRHMKLNCTKLLKCQMCNFTSSNNDEMEEHKKYDNEKVHKKKFRELTKDKFVCQICKWSSKNDMKILLHLIHHPKQMVNKKVVDISILKEYGIMG